MRKLQALLADRSLRAKGLLVVVIPLTPLVLTSLLTSITLRFQREAEAVVDRTELVEDELRALTGLLAEADAGVRGYLFSGDESWLEAHRRAHQRIPATLDHLAALIVDVDQRTRLGRVTTLIDQRLAALDELVSEARQEGRYPAFESRTRFEQGRLSMVSLRSETAYMLGRQKELLGRREGQVQRMEQLLLMVAWLGAAFGVGGGAVAVLLFTTSISSRVRLLQASAEHLARGVPLPALPVGRDEVGLLGRQLERTATLLAERDQALQRAHRTLDRFFALSLDLFCVAGFDGYFKRLNPAWRDTLGWSDDELCARPFLDFVHPDDRESTNCEAGKLAKGLATVQFENRYRCQDGSYRWLQWMAVPVLEEAQIYAIARDVTSNKTAQAQILALNSDLQHRTTELSTQNRELEAFSYSVSHDLTCRSAIRRHRHMKSRFAPTLYSRGNVL
jgi:PAS domain S-box-containing protein